MLRLMEQLVFALTVQLNHDVPWNVAVWHQRQVNVKILSGFINPKMSIWCNRSVCYCSGGPFQTQTLKTAGSHRPAVGFRSETIPTRDHRPRWKDSGLSVCRKTWTHTRTEAPLWAEISLNRGWKVDDVIHMHQPPFVLYIMIHVDPSPSLVIGSFPL